MLDVMTSCYVFSFKMGANFVPSMTQRGGVDREARGRNAFEGYRDYVGARFGGDPRADEPGRLELRGSDMLSPDWQGVPALNSSRKRTVHVVLG